MQEGKYQDLEERATLLGREHLEELPQMKGVLIVIIPEQLL